MMRELAIWGSVFWVLYLPSSIFLLKWTGNGDLIGIVIVGCIFTLLIAAFLILFYRTEVHYGKEEKPEPAHRTRPEVGFSMRTDVNLSLLDADDDIVG